MAGIKNITSDRNETATRNQRGQIIMEFAFAFPFLMVVLLGTFVVGLMLDRQLTVSQLVRNAGNMYARNFDFEPDANKQVQNSVNRRIMGLSHVGIRKSINRRGGTFQCSTRNDQPPQIGA